MTAFEKAGIETFLDFWSQKPNSPEGKLAEAGPRNTISRCMVG